MAPKTNPNELAQRKLKFERVVIEGAARMLWVLAYAEFASANGRCVHCEQTIYLDDNDTWVDASEGDVCVANDDGFHERDEEFWPVAESGQDWGKIASTPRGIEEHETITPAVAFTCANAFFRQFTINESATIADLFEVAMTIHDGEPFEWYEDSGEDSLAKRKLLEKKFEDAEAFGAGIIASAMGTGIGWGDNHRTRRGEAQFEPKLPLVQFDIADFDVVQWAVEGKQTYPWAKGSDSVDRHISIGGPIHGHNNILVNERRHDGEENYIDALDTSQVVMEAVNFLEEYNASMRPVVVDRDPANYRAYYVDEGSGVQSGSTRTLHLSGFFPLEREWIDYLFTKTIGEKNYSIGARQIHIINTPDPSSEEDFAQNFLLWFGSVSPTYLLVFKDAGIDSLDDALNEAVDWIEDHAPGLLCDDEVHDKYQRLVKEACDKKGLPDENMLGDRVLDKLREKSEANTTRAGNHGRYLHGSEWGVDGEDVPIEALRRIAYGSELKQNPPPPLASTKATVNATVIPFVTRTSAASRSRR